MSEQTTKGRPRAEPGASWAPVRLRSHYSIGRGTASVGELVERLDFDGVQAAVLTDVDTLAGLPRFHAACIARSIRPVSGVELTEPGASEPVERRRPSSQGSLWTVSGSAEARRASRVVLLARDASGYERMCRLVSMRSLHVWERTPREPRVLPRMLAETGTEGLFVLTDDPALAAALVEGEVVAPGALRLLLVRPGRSTEEDRVRRVAARLDVQLVADPNPSYLEPQDHRLHLLVRAIRAGVEIGSAALEPGAPWARRHLPRPDEVRRLYRDEPAAVEEGERMLLECAHALLRHPLPLPRPPEVPEEDAPARLARLVRARLADARAVDRCQGAPYGERVDKELAAIGARKLSGYFLVLAEILRGARDERIPVAGRGSAVMSLVGHLLGLSPVDPVAEGLYFERFVHERRTDLPDIDVDVSSARRDRLIEWTHERFGRDHVALASAVHRFGRRSAWREALRALGVGSAHAERILSALPADPEERELAGGLPLDDLPSWAPGEIRRLIGMPRHVAPHPGGVVVTPTHLDRILPVVTLPDGRRMLQYDADSLTALGLPKIDLLGSRALAEIEVATAHLEETGELDEELRRALVDQGPAAAPPDDADTLALLDRADTLGVAKLETPAVRAVLEQVPIRRSADVAAALALVRPGASAGRARIRYVRRARGEPDRRRGRWPLLERVLAETHGVLLYEEDLMRVIAEATRLGLGAADQMRRDLVARQRDPEALTRMEEEFVWKASAAGVELEEAAAIWAELVRFAAYSFNKAHAAGHALLAYQAAYLRVHAPVAYACGVLDHHGGAYPMRTLAAAIARWGVEVRRPHVTHSLDRTVPEGPAGVRLGLGRVRGLSAPTCRRIVGSRAAGPPYAGLADFLHRARPSAPEAAALILLGSCDGLPPLEGSLYPFQHEGVVEAIRSRAGDIDRVTRELAAHVRRRLAGHEPARVDRYRALVRVRNELDLIEMHLSAHPLGILRTEAAALGCRPVTEAAGAVGERVRIAALQGAARRVATRRHRRLRFLTLEDESGLIEALLRPALETAQGHRVTTPGPYLVEGFVRDDHGHVYLDVLDIEPFHWRPARGGRARAEIGSPA